MIIKLLSPDICEVDDRYAGILGRTDEYIAVQFPGKSVYKGSAEGTQYSKTWVAVGKIENVAEDGTLTVDPVLQYQLRK